MKRYSLLLALLVFCGSSHGQRRDSITVARDGSGDFTTVQAAIQAVPDHNQQVFTIFIRNGVYTEKIFIDSLKSFITLVGEDKFNTILTYNDHTGKISPSGQTISTRTSWSFKVLADHFTARNLSFRNDAGFNAGQAVAVESDGDYGRFINCRFTGFQDVLLIDGKQGRQYFKDCYIEGTTDFIFGGATAWFDNCTIHSLKNSHVTAASTPKEQVYGYVFNHCRLTGDTSLHLVSLGRPWRPYAKVVYLNSYMDAHIKAEGWSVWNNNDNHKTTYYAEYKSKGPGANPHKRLAWTHQLTKKEARQYTFKRVLNGWNPESDKP
jgi:pectinesterase